MLKNIYEMVCSMSGWRIHQYLKKNGMQRPALFFLGGASEEENTLLTVSTMLRAEIFLYRAMKRCVVFRFKHECIAK